VIGLPLTDQQAAALAYLDSLHPARAADILAESIGRALLTRDRDATPGLISLMGRYDPKRAAAIAAELQLGLVVGFHLLAVFQRDDRGG
jgi:hypothetical protein